MKLKKEGCHTESGFDHEKLHWGTDESWNQSNLDVPVQKLHVFLRNQRLGYDFPFLLISNSVGGTLKSIIMTENRSEIKSAGNRDESLGAGEGEGEEEMWMGLAD